MPAQGRESDWLFATEEGQWQVAGECGAHRIILVTLGRGHVYGGVTSVNKELSPLVRTAPHARQAPKIVAL